MTSETAGPPIARTPPRPVIPDVLAQHLEEHGFLCLQRRRLIFSTEFPLRRLPAHDERIEAHWDGLRIGGADSVKLALEKLEAKDPWEIATAARVWVELGKPTAAAVAEKLAAAPPERAASWREALRQCPADVVKEALPARNVSAFPPHALAVAVDALAWHGALPVSLAEQAVRHADAAVRAAIARALPHAGLADAARPSQALLDDVALAVGRRALWSAALMARESALERARRAARGAAPDPFAVRVLGLLGAPEDHALVVDAAATDTGRPAAFWAFADLGTSEAVESLTRLLTLSDKELCAVAGEALEFAVGTVKRPKPDHPPTPEQARAHWEGVSATLPRGARVLGGHAVPWRGDRADEPMRWRWLAALSGRCADAPWLAREVPDGFFDALPVPDARPGE
jgi:uncharacterized protein (TIGR02270 family)